jgi:lipopolysaccharide export system permease protein
MILRRHDRYVLRAYLATFAAVMFFFTVIVVVLDGAERLRQVTRYWDQIVARGQHPLLVMAEFYATLLPFLWLRMLPFCVAASAAFCLARFVRHNELTPLLTTGVSMRRIVRPILVCGVVLVGAHFAVQETLVPPLNRRNLRLRRILSRNTPDRITQVPHFHDRRGGRLSMEAYLPFQQRMRAPMIGFYDPRSGRPRELLRYPELAWDAARRVWVAPRGGRRIVLDPEAPGRERPPIAPGSVAPLDASAALIEIALTAKVSVGLSLHQVEALERANPENPQFTVLKHELFTMPLGVLVLLLFSLPLSFRVARRTRSAIPGMLGAGGLAALFFGTQFFAASLARAGDWNPVVLTWFPVVLFGSLGLALYLTMDD